MAIVSRKWRGLAWLVAALAGALGFYALAGFFLVPFLAQTQLWPTLSQNLGSQIQAQSTVFNPFSFSLVLEGISLKTPQGNALVEIGEAAIDLDLPATLRSRTLVAKARIERPSVNLFFDKQGQPNYAFLIPKESKEEPAKTAFPFLVTELLLEQGRLVFADQSIGKGFKEVFQPLSFSLVNFGSAPESVGHFKLETQGEGKETVNLEGEIRLSQMALQGEAKLGDLNLAPLSEWLASGLPYSLRSGVLSLNLKWRFTQETGFEITSAETQAKELSLTQGGQAFLSSGSITAQGLGYQGKTNQITFDALNLESLTLQLPTPVELTALKAQGLSYQIGLNRLDVQTLNLDKAALKSSTPAEFSTLTALGLSYEGTENRLELKSVSANQFKLNQGSQPLVEVAAFSAQDFIYRIAKGKLDLAFIKLDTIDLKTPSPVVDKEGKERQFQVDSLSLGGLGVDLPGKSVEISQIQSSRSFLAAWLNKDGSSGISGLPTKLGGTGKAESQPKEKPWQVKLERVDLQDNTILLRDFSFDPPAKMRLSNLNLLVKTFDSAADQPFWIGMNTALSMNGRIAMEGNIKLAPLTINLKLYVDDLSLPPFQAYLDPWARIQLVKGLLNTNAEIGYDEAEGGKLRIGGDVAVANFASQDKQEYRDFVNWTGLRINGLVFETSPKRLSIHDMAFSKPYVRAFLSPDKQFNFVENLSPPPQPKPISPAMSDAIQPIAKPEEPMSVLIGVLRINEGAVDFTDFTIKPPPFWVNIRDLNGNIRSLSSHPDAKSDVLLEGKLNEGSAVKIFGKINPFSLQAFTDVTIESKGVNLATLSPYSAKFAGYRIEKGKISMDLRYKLDKGQMTAENKFVFDQLELGERVESKEATTLPVSLAVSLLKDRDGKIDISLPISGDLSNPDVSIGSLMAGAATELVSKLVSSPLSILGGLFAGSVEEPESVKFSPGIATLSPLEKQKLASVAEVMKLRPSLNLDIKGVADADLDKPVLAETDLSRQLKNAKLIELGRRKGQQAEWDGISLGVEDYNRLLTNLYRWKTPEAPELQGLKTGTYLGGEVLETAKRKLLDKWTVSEMDLRGLARTRSESIRNYLVQSQGLSDQRIYLLNVMLAEKGAKEIKAQLSLSGQ